MHLSRSLTAVVASLGLALGALAFATPAPAGTLDRVRDSGKLRIGYRADARPFSYRAESGQAEGYSIALCARIADAVKAELGLRNLAIEYVPVTSEDRLPAVSEGRIDLLCAEATVTLARRKQAAFSIPIYPSGLGALVRSDAPATFREILAGGPPPPDRPRWRASMAQVLEKRTFSAVAGTTGEAWLRERKSTLKVSSEIVPVPSYEVGVQRVLTRGSDAFFADRPILLDAMQRSKPAGELLMIDRLFTYEPLALALERGDEDFRLLVDRTLSDIYRSGEVWKIYKSSFGEPDDATLSFFRLNALPE